VASPTRNHVPVDRPVSRVVLGAPKPHDFLDESAGRFDGRSRILLGRRNGATSPLTLSSTRCRREAAQEGDADGDSDGQIEGKEGFAALGSPRMIPMASHITYP
jgi:hypothetical protein